MQNLPGLFHIVGIGALCLAATWNASLSRDIVRQDPGHAWMLLDDFSRGSRGDARGHD